MPSFVNLPEGQIFAVGLPLAGNGKASTAPGLVVRKMNSEQFCVPFSYWWGVNGLVTRHSPDSNYPKTIKCRRSSICPSGKFLPKESRSRETAKPLPPPVLVVRINEYRAKSPVFFCYWWGVNGLVTRHSPDTTYVVRKMNSEQFCVPFSYW